MGIAYFSKQKFQKLGISQNPIFTKICRKITPILRPRNSRNLRFPRKEKKLLAFFFFQNPVKIPKTKTTKKPLKV